MKRFVVLLVLGCALVSVLMGASQAGASTHLPFSITLTCGGQQYPALLTGTIQIVGTTPQTVYKIVTQSYTDESGTHVLISNHAYSNGAPLVACTYIGPLSGRLYMNTGFFTPGLAFAAR
jgi:hypothetical protein